jgi:acyl carrier protein
MDTSIIIRDYIVDNILNGQDDPPLSVEDNLIESGIIDSLGIMSLLMFIEEKFAIAINPDDLIPENFSSVQSITCTVDRQKCN